MSPALDELRSLLVRLHDGHGGSGLKGAAADRLTEALDRGLPLSEAALGTGLDDRIVRAADAGGAPDLPAALAGLARLASEHDAGTRRLRSAAFYPLILAFTVLVPGCVLVAATLPALQLLPGSGLAGSGTWLLPLLVTAAVLLLALGATVLGRVPLPWLTAGWAQLDRVAFVAALRALTDAGAPLPAATRGASAWSRGRARTAALDLARSLEAGEPTRDLRPLMAPHEASALAAGAEAGTAAETLAALESVVRAALDRTLPDTIVRVQGCALTLAGGALLTVGITLFRAYSLALLG